MENFTRNFLEGNNFVIKYIFFLAIFVVVAAILGTILLILIANKDKKKFQNKDN